MIGDELRYKIMKGTECFASSKTSVFLNEDYDSTINSRERKGVTEYLM